MPGFSYGGKGDGTNWSSERGSGPGRGVDHPSPSSAEVKERVQLHLYSLSGPSWPVLGRPLPLPLPLPLIFFATFFVAVRYEVHQ